mgnify:FL=1
MGKVLFGPSGNSESFFNEGHSATLESPAWVKAKGLDLFEYSFGQGYRMSSDTAVKIGNEFKKEGIELSVHAPYFINFANPDDEMFSKTIGYISTGIKFLKNLQAKRLIFHPASCGKQTREEAVKLMMERFKEVMPDFEKELDDDMFLCPETMGKLMQIGTYKEVIDLCTISSKLIPTFDFGHINALTQGSLKSADDYKRIFDYCFEKLGEERTKNAHIHFSKIQYGSKGEIRHLTFEDDVYGPNFEDLAKVLVDYDLSCHVVCESAGTQAEDSLIMKDIYTKTLAK